MDGGVFSAMTTHAIEGTNRRFCRKKQIPKEAPTEVLHGFREKV